MYESDFGIRKNPFGMSPDPAALFATSGHREVLAGLLYTVMRRKGFGLLVGEAGTGKSTLISRLRGLVPQKAVEIHVISNPTLTPSEFVEFLMMKFGIENIPVSKAARLNLLEKYLLEKARAGRIPVLVVDEAHVLSHEVLEEIRLLGNFETAEYKLIQTILAGQPELEDILNRPELWQLKQRISVRLRLRPLEPQLVREYIQHRWSFAGGSGPAPFDEKAIDLIAEVSLGIIRIVNSICDQSMLLASKCDPRIVSLEHVAEVAQDLNLTIGVPVIQPPPPPIQPLASVQSPKAPVVKAEPSREEPKQPAAEEAKPDSPEDFKIFQNFMPPRQQASFFVRWAARVRA
jgi:general secretion pathway protein A